MDNNRDNYNGNFMTAAENKLFRELFDEKIKVITVSMDSHFANVNSELVPIRKQVELTNSRVTHLEDDMKMVRTNITEHSEDCPAKADIAAMKEDLVEYKFFKRYPKLTAIIIALFAIGIFIAAYGTFSSIAGNVKAKKTDVTIERIDENTK